MTTVATTDATLAQETEYDAEFTPEIQALARKAGFCMWSDEGWRPMFGLVDWSCYYDDELIKFYHLVREQVLKENT